MATGGGKSICYQLPPMVYRNIGILATTIVITPLIALMEDQVIGLKRKGIPAAFLSGSNENSREIENKAANGEYALLYITPEKALTWSHGFKRILSNGIKIVSVAIDECHCVCAWGHDFRPAFRRLREIRELLKGPEVSYTIPIMALTATATADMVSDIIESLDLHAPVISQTTFDRPNLYYGLYEKTDIIEDFKEVFRPVKPFSGGRNSDTITSTIVYCRTRSDADEIADVIRFKLKFTSVASYHAGLSDERRREVHKAFKVDKIRIIVATIAFGMGIDKQDVRLIVHYGMPKSIIEYYQQTGRAGRDGRPSRCVGFYTKRDFSSSAFVIQNDNSISSARKNTLHSLLQTMRDYCCRSSSKCLRQLIVEYFGESYNKSSNNNNNNNNDNILDKDRADSICCSNCEAKKLIQPSSSSNLSFRTGSSVAAVDITTPMRLLCSAVLETGERYGITTVVNVLKGMNTSSSLKAKPWLTKVQSFDKARTLWKVESMEWWKKFVDFAIELEYLCTKRVDSTRWKSKSNSFNQSHVYSVLKLTEKGRCLVYNTLTNIENVLPPTGLFFKRGVSTASSTSSTRPSGGIGAVISSAVQSNNSNKNLLMSALMKARADCAMREEGLVAPYEICSETLLLSMTKILPRTLNDIRDLDGVNEIFLQTYGNKFLNTINLFLKNKNNSINNSINNEAVFVRMTGKRASSSLDRDSLVNLTSITPSQLNRLSNDPLVLDKSTKFSRKRRKRKPAQL